ncbi:MAG: hypothetical protein SFV17_08185 [Candidatus Obscuribacter sp.]|nr:hypothetical protein [Candidatus Obscuribacter sp.]
MSHQISTTLTIISLVIVSVSAPTPAGAADPKCIPNSLLFPSAEQQDALSRFMCGPGGGTYPSAIPGSSSNAASISPFTFSANPTSPSRPDNSLLGATFGSGLGSDLSQSSLTGSKPHENCNQFITPEPGDSLSQFMCGPGGGKYLIPGLLNGLPNLPASNSPTTALPPLPTVLPSASPRPAPVSNEPAKLPSPPVAPITAAKTEAPSTADPVPSPSLHPAAAPPPPAVAANPPQTGTPARASAPEKTSILDNPVFYLVAGILVLVILAGGLMLLTGDSTEADSANQEDSD